MVRAEVLAGPQGWPGSVRQADPAEDVTNVDSGSRDRISVGYACVGYRLVRSRETL
jgi:hypothetical protein